MSFAGSSCLLVCHRNLRTYRSFEAHELSYEQWKSVLHLSTRWGFASLRKLAIKSIRPPTSHDQLVLARTYSVEQWVLPALTALCSRALPLSLDEARQMDIEDVILVAAVREEIRGDELRVDAVDIPQHVEMAQANNRLVSKVYGSTGQESGLTADPASQSVNASTTDLFGDSLKADSPSKYVPAESGESELLPMGKALQTEKLDGIPSEEVHSREHPTLTTEVPVAVHVAIAGPTTAGDSRDGGGLGEDEDRESGNKVANDPLALLVNRATKDSTSVGAPATLIAEDDWGTPVRTKKSGAISLTLGIPCAGGGDNGWGIPMSTKKKSGASASTPVDDWATPVRTKKKRGAISGTLGIPCAGGEDEWGIPMKTKKGGASASTLVDDWGIPVRTKKKGGASASTPVVPGAFGGGF